MEEKINLCKKCNKIPTNQNYNLCQTCYKQYIARKFNNICKKCKINNVNKNYFLCVSCYNKKKSYYNKKKSTKQNLWTYCANCSLRIFNCGNSLCRSCLNKLIGDNLWTNCTNCHRKMIDCKDNICQYCYNKMTYCINCNVKIFNCKDNQCYNCLNKAKFKKIAFLNKDFNNNLFGLNLFNLPTEIIVLIFSALEVKFMLNCKLVCNKFNIINTDKNNVSMFIDSHLKRFYKKKYLSLSKFIDLNLDMLKKIKINIFIKNSNNDFESSGELLFTRLFRMFNLKTIIGIKIMHPPHKFSLSLIDKINMDLTERECLFSNLKEIIHINGEYYIFSNEKEINLFVNRN